MKVVILAGGFGTRISEESYLKPKPMIEIGNKPILWHIMKEYSAHGFHEFIICCGYKQHVIKEWFSNYYLYNSDVTFDFTSDNRMFVHNNITEPWRVSLIDTGLNTMTGGRIKRIAPYVNGETFMLTYGDAVSDVNIKSLLEFHKSHGKVATITTVKEKQRFGILKIDDLGKVESFREKTEIDDSTINGGYMVLEPSIFDYLEDDQTVFEKKPLEKLVKEGNLMAFRHNGFWQCMDTQREKKMLEDMWEARTAPWKIWE